MNLYEVKCPKTRVVVHYLSPLSCIVVEARFFRPANVFEGCTKGSSDTPGSSSPTAATAACAAAAATRGLPYPTAMLPAKTGPNHQL